MFDEIVKRGAFSEKDAADILKQCVAAVDYLHSQGIVHRDLKVRSESADHQRCGPDANFSFSQRTCCLHPMKPKLSKLLILISDLFCPLSTCSFLYNMKV